MQAKHRLWKSIMVEKNLITFEDCFSEVYLQKDTNDQQIKPISHLCLLKVNTDRPIYEKMKFSAKKFSNPKV